MAALRKIFRFTALILMVVIVIIAGYNIVLRCLYPQNYSEIIEKYSEEYNVRPTLVCAIIKCESGFEPTAKSSSDARGLMQLMEETFYDMQKLLDDPKSITYQEHCFDEEINIKYGTRYLRYLSDMFNGDEISVIAAYNAGPGNVKKWLDGKKTLKEADIEFSETAKYVKRVLETQEYYKKLYN